MMLGAGGMAKGADILAKGATGASRRKHITSFSISYLSIAEHSDNA
jgi:hypothetical protein